MTRALSWDDVVARRVDASHLAERAPADRLLEVVSDTCGLQAQLLTAAELGIAARVADVTQADVRAELWERRRLVKAHSIRGTIHVHAASDLPLFMAALRAVAWWREPAWLRARGLLVDQIDRVTQAAREALDGRALTYRQLETEIVERVGAWAGRPLEWRPFGQDDWGLWRQLLNPAEGPFCFGPNRGSEVTIVRADQWIEGWHDVDPSEALREVLRRYLRAYGPATAADFGHWFHVKPAASRRLVESMRRELEEIDVEGFGGWTLARHPEPPPPAHGRSARLVPDYDAYTIGCHPPGPQRDRLIPRESGRRVFGGGAGPFAAVLIDGLVAGVWKRRQRGRRLEVRIESFGRMAVDFKRKLEAEGDRIGAFLQLDAAVSFA